MEAGEGAAMCEGAHEYMHMHMHMYMCIYMYMCEREAA
jgi:hypothetical protein